MNIFENKKPIRVVSLDDVLISTYTEQVFSPAILGPNLPAELGDNSRNAGGGACSTSVKDGSLIHADNGNGFKGNDVDEVVDNIVNEYLYRPKAKDVVNSAQSNELAGVGGSRNVYQVGVHRYAGTKTSFGSYIVWRYLYKFSTPDVDIEDMSTKQFADKNLEIDIEFYEVTREEFTQLHGLGGQYDGFFDSISLYNNLKFTPNYGDIMKYIRKRYNEVTLHMELEVGNFKGIAEPLFYPMNDGTLKSSYRSWRPAMNKNMENFHVIETEAGEYHVEVFCTEVLRASQTHELEDLYRKVGGIDNVYEWESTKLDRPEGDIYGSNDVHLFPFQQVSLSTRQFDTILNNLKFGVKLLPSSPNTPSSVQKDKSNDPDFLKALTVRLKQLVKLNGWESSTKARAKTKQETEEVLNWLDILQDDSHVSHDMVAANAGKLLGIPIDDVTKGWKDDIHKTYQHNLDAVWYNPKGEGSKDVLVEWQINTMDDEHYTEFVARLLMDTEEYNQFKTVAWVHGGSGSGLQLKKLKKNVVKTFGKALYEKRGIERIVVIDKKELFLQGGHKTAEVMSLPTK